MPETSHWIVDRLLVNFCPKLAELFVVFRVQPQSAIITPCVEKIPGRIAVGVKNRLVGFYTLLKNIEFPYCIDDSRQVSGPTRQAFRYGAGYTRKVAHIGGERIGGRCRKRSLLGSLQELRLFRRRFQRDRVLGENFIGRISRPLDNG